MENLKIKSYISLVCYKNLSLLLEINKKPVNIDCFDETTFRFMFESVKVDKDKALTFKFRNGKEIVV